MLSVLQDYSAETSKYQINVVKTLKITEYDGDNTKTVFSLINGVISCLVNLLDSNFQSTLPEKFANFLLDVFKTTSVIKFNALFVHYSVVTRVTEFQTNTSNNPHIIEIL